ncbi:hypothetical protein B0H14DRAFT_2577786 [Mycena olivaceomarginata]|nr:hypothetical protein B0H14DRAFT_2577786 [Mycena olivaceomarginata]
MLNALWGFIFPKKQQAEPPPRQHPRKYPRTPAVHLLGSLKRVRQMNASPGQNLLRHLTSSRTARISMANEPTTSVLSPLSDAPMDVDPVKSNIEAQSKECCGEKRRHEETSGDDEVPEPCSFKIPKVILSLCIPINVSQMSPQAVIGLNWAERANLALTASYLKLLAVGFKLLMVSKDAEAAVPAKPGQPVSRLSAQGPLKKAGSLSLILQRSSAFTTILPSRCPLQPSREFATYSVREILRLWSKSSLIETLQDLKLNYNSRIINCRTAQAVEDSPGSPGFELPWSGIRSGAWFLNLGGFTYQSSFYILCDVLQLTDANVSNPWPSNSSTFKNLECINGWLTCILRDLFLFHAFTFLRCFLTDFPAAFACFFLDSWASVLKRKATCYIHQSAIYALPASGPGIRIQFSDVQQARHYASTFANISIEVVEFAGASGLATDGSLSIDRDAA